MPITSKPKVKDVLVEKVFFKLNNGFDGITYTIIDDNLIRLFWEGSLDDPWFKVTAKSAGDMLMDYQLSTAVGSSDEGSVQNPVIVSTDYYFANNPAAKPTNGFQEFASGTCNLSIAYYPTVGMVRNYAVSSYIGSKRSNGTGGFRKFFKVTVEVFEGTNVTPYN